MAQAYGAWSAVPASLLPARGPAGDGPGWTVLGSAADFEAVDAVPVRAFSGDWGRYASRGGTNFALQSIRVETAAQWQHWEIAATVRSELLIRGSRGAFDLVHDFKQRQTPADGSELPLRVDESGVVWSGLRLAHTWVWQPASGQGLELTAAISSMSVWRVKRVAANGQVKFGASSGWAFDVQAMQQDSQRQFGGFGKLDAKGSGYTSDLGVLWQPSLRSFVNFSAIDVLSHIAVGEVSTQQLVASTATSSLDSQGYVQYQPLLSGSNQAANVDMRLTPKWSAIAGSTFDFAGTDVLAGARWERVSTLDLPSLWLVFPVGAGWRLQFDAELHFRTLGVGIASRNASLLLRTRSLPVGQSNALGWQASVTVDL